MESRVEFLEQIHPSSDDLKWMGACFRTNELNILIQLILCNPSLLEPWHLKLIFNADIFTPPYEISAAPRLLGSILVCWCFWSHFMFILCLFLHILKQVPTTSVVLESTAARLFGSEAPENVQRTTRLPLTFPRCRGDYIMSAFQMLWVNVSFKCAL